MATIKIASLPSATTIEETDLFLLDQTDATRKLSVSDFKDKLNLVTDETLGSNSGASTIGTSSGKNIQEILDEGGDAVSLHQGGTVQDAIYWITPEMFGAKGDGITDDTLAITSAINKAVETGLELHFSGRTYISSTQVIKSPIKIKLTSGAYLNFSIVVQGEHFDFKNKVSTTIPWASFPANTSVISGNFSTFTVGSAVGIKLNDTDGGSASQGNEAGMDFSLISASNSAALTLGTATRLSYQNPDVFELNKAFNYVGTLSAGTFSIPGDYTSLFSKDDILRIENLTGSDSVEAHLYYFEFVKVLKVTSTEMTLKARLNYSHTNPWIVKTGFIKSPSIVGEGRIKRLEIRQCDTPLVRGINVDRLVVGNTYDSTVENINSVGVAEPSSVNHTYCFGRSVARNIRAGGSSATTDNAAIKFMSCPMMLISNVVADNTTATGSQGDYGFYIDAFYTPYYSWNKGTMVQAVIIETARATVTRSAWIYGMLNGVVEGISGSQVFLQGCANSSFSGICSPDNALELRDLASCSVEAFCKSALILGSLDTDFKIKTTGLGTGSSLNIAVRLGAGVTNPLTGSSYTIGSRNKLDVWSLSDSTSAITISAQSQDSLLIGEQCRDKSTVSASISFASGITNPSMLPNFLKGSVAAGSGWVGPRQKGGTDFFGDYRDGYIILNGYYCWVGSDGRLRLSSVKPTSDNPSGVIIVGPVTKGTAVSPSAGTDPASVTVNALITSLITNGILSSS